MASPIITLTTDFGQRDGFVAAMKGVVFSICPNAALVDISHEVPPHDIAHGAFVIGNTSPFFPQGTIHVGVVDPGVGSSRHPLLLDTPMGYFVGPDNGLFSYVLLGCEAGNSLSMSQLEINRDPMAPTRLPAPRSCSAYLLNRADYWLSQVSNTFHGRDIFAPVAAHLARGVAPSHLGQKVDELTFLKIPQPVTRGRSTWGNVIFIDRFGNLVTNIPESSVSEKDITVIISGRSIRGLSPSYSNVSSGLLATIGSHGNLEIAVRRGSAAQFLEAEVGTRLEVRLPPDLVVP